MDTPLILHLVGLRYKLLWAQTRTRNGRIALFLAGYLFAVLILLLMTAGGYGAAMIAVRSGQAEKVAQAVLGGLFLQALVASVVTGFGINTAFTDAALRRYALSARDRLAARHLIGILEPVWIFVLGLDLGLSTGMYVFGAGSFWLGAAAVLLLLITDYLLARVLATLIEWLSHVRGGTAILFAMLIIACMLPGLLIPRLANAHGAKAGMMAVLHYTPPFAAAALMVHAGTGLLSNFGLLAVWIAALLVALAAIEKQAARPRSAAAAAVAWDDRYERIASIFGPAMAPLIGRTLRYYVRSNKVRFNYIAAIPLLAFLTFVQQPHGGRAAALFRACTGRFRGRRIPGHSGDVHQPVRLRRLRFPALLPAAGRSRRDPARLEFHGVVGGRHTGGRRAGAVAVLCASPIRRAHGSHAAGQRRGWAVPVQRAVDLDFAARAAAHELRNHLRQPALVDRQRVTHWRFAWMRLRRGCIGQNGWPGRRAELLVGVDSGSGAGHRFLFLLPAARSGRVCKPQRAPLERP